MPNLFSSVGTAFVNTFSSFLSYALPLLAVAILGLLAAIAAVNFLLGLFGFKLGVSEKFREKLRRKLKSKKSANFPFSVKKRTTGLQADAKSPWTNPAEWSQVNQDMLFAGEQIDADLDYFIAADPSGKTNVIDHEEYVNHASNVSSNWSNYFGHLGSIDGLINAKISEDERKYLYFHAATIVQLKHEALSENAQEWAKQYGDGQASAPVKFVA